MQKPRFPLELLEEQRNFCLHNFGCALEQVFFSEPGTEKKRKGCKWMLRTLEMLDEIEALIEEGRRADQEENPT